ncbi:MAG: 3-dehydroquinate synthase [Candidatus Nanopelagicales bacterium]|nr:3-dehydroquinate synthase [Candidatus Nanopelagicales bacterium]MDZ4249373.1 3-dehydroquinate synthase [Candidatus Nanopelagicales bacterium]
MAPIIVLVGPPGSGKTTIGQALSARLGVGFRDTDADVESAQGMSIADVFVTSGEPAFRALELTAVSQALREHHGVLALGGGSVESAPIRESLAGQPVVELEVSPGEAVRRVGPVDSRPVLLGNARAALAERAVNDDSAAPMPPKDIQEAWTRLVARRKPLYAQVRRVAVSTDGRDVADVVDEIVSRLMLTPPAIVPARLVRVAGSRPYDVTIGRGVLPEVAQTLPAAAHKVAVIHAPVMADVAARLAVDLDANGREALLLAVPDSESAKTSTVADQCWERLGVGGFTRTDAVVGLGGGATTDLAGFVAATWLRGVAVVQVPTTLLAMVDAAVGGKTGINTSAGKNLVGAFHPPIGVICDLDLLATVPPPDLAAGMAEVVKAGFIADPAILELIEADPSAALDPASPASGELIERAIRVKAAVVADDLTESLDRVLGREILNYGHTFAHAIEKVEAFTWRHGDAVSVGMCFAAELACAAGRLSREGVDRHYRVLSSLGLPTAYPGGDWDALSQAMRVDKKVRAGTLRIIVLDRVGKPGLLEAPDDAWLNAAFEAVT